MRSIASLFITILGFVVLCCGFAAPAGAQAEIREIPSAGRKVALTVNVVWGTEFVLPMARAIHAQGGRATFFLGGLWAQQHPLEARELRRLGMEIGNHGYGHVHVGQLGVEANRREIQRARDAIASASGVRPVLYAPAYGELSPAVFRAAQLEGSTVVMWAIDTIDWRPSHTASIITSRVLQRLRPGAIVLMHPTVRTLAALQDLLPALKSRGYSLVTVGDLMTIAGPKFSTGGMHARSARPAGRSVAFRLHQLLPGGRVSPRA